jgi:hypothetical protein
LRKVFAGRQLSADPLGCVTKMVDWPAMLNVLPRSAPSAYGQFELVGDDLVSFGPTAFGVLAKWPMPNGGLVVSLLCWAPDQGAARRALMREPASDRGALITPPEALLAAPEAITYAQIKSIGEAKGHDHGFTFTRTGSCVGHYLAIRRFTYLFRSGALEPSEQLYAIQVDPDPSFWELIAGVDLAALAHALEDSRVLHGIRVDARGLHARFESSQIRLDLAVWPNGCCDLQSLSPADLEPQQRHFEFRSTDHAIAVLQQELRAFAEARSPTSR